MKRCFRLTKRCFIDTKTFRIDKKSSPPWPKGIFRLMKTFRMLKVGGFKLIEYLWIERGSSRPGITIAL